MKNKLALALGALLLLTGCASTPASESPAAGQTGGTDGELRGYVLLGTLCVALLYLQTAGPLLIRGGTAMTNYIRRKRKKCFFILKSYRKKVTRKKKPYKRSRKCKGVRCHGKEKPGKIEPRQPAGNGRHCGRGCSTSGSVYGPEP